MLVKWAIEERRKTAKLGPTTNDDDQHGVASTSSPPSMENLSGKDEPQIAGVGAGPETTAQALTAELDRLHFESDAAFAKSSESIGDRAMRRIRAEERDTMLRDDKLLSLTGPSLLRHSSHQGRENEPSMPLTEENIGKLAHEQDEPHLTNPDRTANPVNKPQSLSDKRSRQVVSRPSLNSHVRESEQTVKRSHSPT
jgi:hypothetical protein